MSEMTAGKIWFCTDIKLSANELRNWEPERIFAFFDGITKAIEAKDNLAQFQSLTARLGEAERKLGVYKKAVDFYADEENWVLNEICNSDGDFTGNDPELRHWGLHVARAAIREAEGE